MSGVAAGVDVYRQKKQPPRAHVDAPSRTPGPASLYARWNVWPHTSSRAVFHVMVWRRRMGGAIVGRGNCGTGQMQGPAPAGPGGLNARVPHFGALVGGTRVNWRVLCSFLELDMCSLCSGGPASAPAVLLSARPVGPVLQAGTHAGPHGHRRCVPSDLKPPDSQGLASFLKRAKRVRSRRSIKPPVDAWRLAWEGCHPHPSPVPLLLPPPDHRERVSERQRCMPSPISATPIYLLACLALPAL